MEFNKLVKLLDNVYTKQFWDPMHQKALCKNPKTSKIIGFSDAFVLKYIINTGTDSSFNIPALSSRDYEVIVSTTNNSLLSAIRLSTSRNKSKYRKSTLFIRARSSGRRYKQN